MHVIKPKLGFNLTNQALDAVINQGFALVFLLILAPLFAFIAIALLATQGREIFYRGPRLGRDRRVFGILKFRTLDTRSARTLTANCILPTDAGIETPLGSFLRSSRLDELPQLLNVLMGDMRFCGPRPVRPEIAAIEERNIPNYAVRFSVKPGLIGPSQAYMSHRTSKRIRARLNNILLSRPVNYWAEMWLMAEVGTHVLTCAIGKILRAIVHQIAGEPSEHIHERHPIPELWLYIEGSDQVMRIKRMCTRSLNLTDSIALIHETRGEFFAKIQNGGLRRAQVLLTPSEKPGVVGYSATTDFGQFIIDRYGLGLAVVRPKLVRSPVMPGISTPLIELHLAGLRDHQSAYGAGALAETTVPTR